MKTDKDVFTRLYNDAQRKQSQKKEGSTEEKQKRPSFEPTISPTAKNIKREGNIFDTLYKDAERKNEKEKQKRESVGSPSKFASPSKNKKEEK